MDPQQPALGVQVRARVQEDLMRLLELIDPAESSVLGTEVSLSIIRTPVNDYGWRVYMTHEQWARALAVMAQRITYHNFKAEVTRVQGAWRHDIYMRVWSVLLSLQRPARPVFDTRTLFDAYGGQPMSKKARKRAAARARATAAEGRWDEVTQYEWDPDGPWQTDIERSSIAQNWHERLR